MSFLDDFFEFVSMLIDTVITSGASLYQLVIASFSILKLIDLPCVTSHDVLVGL